MPFKAVIFNAEDPERQDALKALDKLEADGYEFAGITPSYTYRKGNREIVVLPQILMNKPIRGMVEWVDEANRLRVQLDRVRQTAADDIQGMKIQCESFLERAEKAEIALAAERMLHETTHEALEEARARLAVAANQS